MQRIHDRKENRVQSLQAMRDETKKMTKQYHHGNLPPERAHLQTEEEARNYVENLQEKQKPKRLYQAMELNYNENIVQREMQERSQALQQLKAQKQSVNRSEISDHQKKYDDIIRKNRDQFNIGDELNADIDFADEMPEMARQPKFTSKLYEETRKKDRELKLKGELQFE